MKTSRRFRLLAMLLALTAIVAACSSDSTNDADGGDDDETPFVNAGDGESVLDAVRDADVVKCGTRDALPGFAVLGEDGEFTGFDSDFCRVIAAAVLGDADKVDMVPLETANRFTALQSGEIDVLVRNTTWTATRDGGEGAAFGPTTVYDGQAMMVLADSEFQSLDDMDGTTVCLAEGTTTQLNLTTAFESRDIDLEEALSFADTDLVQEAFLAGRCDGWTSDSSQLISLRSSYPESDGGPEALRILSDIFSKEPLGPAVADGDTAWFDAVRWAVFATIQAEEFGIDSDNLDDFLESDNADILRFLGVEDGDAEPFDAGIGLDPEFARNVIAQVGNYGQIWDRHLTPLGLERGPNSLWTDGGLLYAPPYR